MKDMSWADACAKPSGELTDIGFPMRPTSRYPMSGFVLPTARRQAPDPCHGDDLSRRMFSTVKCRYRHLERESNPRPIVFQRLLYPPELSRVTSQESNLSELPSLVEMVCSVAAAYPRKTPRRIAGTSGASEPRLVGQATDRAIALDLARCVPTLHR